MIWNVQMNNLKEMSGWMCVCVRVRARVCVWEIRQIQASVFREWVGIFWDTIWCAPKVSTTLLLILFFVNWLIDWYCTTIWIFWKIVVITLAAANFKRLRQIVHFKEINVQWCLGLNLEKIYRSSVQILWSFGFLKKGHFRFKWRAIQR